MMLTATLFSATLGEDEKIEPPLGPLYIASALESRGWSVDFRDYQLFEGANAFDSLTMHRCLDGHADILLISCFVDMLPAVIATARRVKRDRPNTFIMLGGPGPTAKARELLETFDAVDAIVQGEGEQTITEWADQVAKVGLDRDKWKSIAGCVFRSGAGIVSGGARDRIKNAETIIGPAYHLLNWSSYASARIITTRGCPYHCSFCDVAPLWNRKAVYRNLSNTIDEMATLKYQYGKDKIAIVDDTFVLSRERVRTFCRMLIERQLDIRWGCFGRINLMSKELIDLMARAGCCVIFYGIDSGSPNLLARISKEIDAATILPTLEHSAQAFDLVEASFIWGYPFETYDDFRRTLELAASASRFAPRINVQLHMLSPLPSSPMYTEFKGELVKPKAADKSWLLLPGLLLDRRAQEVRGVIETAPHLFPGFFSFPTPAIGRKRAQLRAILRAMEQFVGRVLLDDEVYELMDRENRNTELCFLDRARNPTELIGAGLALGVFRKARQRAARDDGALRTGGRGSLVRQRNDVVNA